MLGGPQHRCPNQVTQLSAACGDAVRRRPTPDDWLRRSSQRSGACCLSATRHWTHSAPTPPACWRPSKRARPLNPRRLWSIPAESGHPSGAQGDPPAQPSHLRHPAGHYRGPPGVAGLGGGSLNEASRDDPWRWSPDPGGPPLRRSDRNPRRQDANWLRGAVTAAALAPDRQRGPVLPYSARAQRATAVRNAGRCNRRRRASSGLR